MHWTKLNTNFDAEPNAPTPRVWLNGSSVVVRFFLNPFIWKDVEENQEACLVFHNAHLYRLGSTNDEGFYLGQCRFSGTGIEWGNFYELHDSNWRQDFPLDRVTLSPNACAASDFKHYLFYFRDETFECIAMGFEFERLEPRRRPTCD